MPRGQPSCGVAAVRYSSRSSERYAVGHLAGGIGRRSQHFLARLSCAASAEDGSWPADHLPARKPRRITES